MHSPFARRSIGPFLGALIVSLGLRAGVAAEPKTVLSLWPQAAAGDPAAANAERDTTSDRDGQVAGQRVIRLGNVTQPSIAIYPPPSGQNTGAAVVVCPGGGYNILAMDLEGTEICDWLNSIGVTGVLLKYRVPRREGMEKHALPLQDVQRAMGMVRSRAQEWNIDPKRVGVLGFSAGGHLAAAVSNNYEGRSYPPSDTADLASCRPDFCVLIYPAYLTVKEENDKIAPELKVSATTPPTFLAMTEDDPIRVETALFYALALHNAKVPVELHVYPKGGHGYGLRHSDNAVTTWPQRAEEWMRTGGWLHH